MSGLTPAQRRQRDKLLKDSGFVDLEDEAGDLRTVRDRVVSGHAHRLEDIEGLADYYRRAAQVLHDHAWKTPVERRIWELHAEGASYTRIWRTVKREIQAGDLPAEKMYRRRVHATVNRVKGIMMGTRAKPRGRPRDPTSMRSKGMRVRARLHDAAALALDHIRTALGVSEPEAVRIALVEAANRIPGRP